MGIRTVGVGEEFLLVEADGRARPLIERVLAGIEAGPDQRLAGTAEHELMQEQAETASSPHRDLSALHADLAGRRRDLAAAVTASGGRCVPWRPARSQWIRPRRTTNATAGSCTSTASPLPNS